MKPPSDCTKDGYIATWDSINDQIREAKKCQCLCCTDWLEHECPDFLIDNPKQTTL